MSLEQIKDITEKVISYLKRKCLCPEQVEDKEIVDYIYAQQQPSGKIDKYSFIDDTELSAIKRIMTGGSFNRFLQLDELKHDIDTRIATLHDQELQRDTLLRQQSGGNAELIKEYEEAERNLDVCKMAADDLNSEITNWISRFTGMTFRFNRSRM